MLRRAWRYARCHAAAVGPSAIVRALRERTSPFACPVCGRRVDGFLPLYENFGRLATAGFDLVRRPLQTLHWNAYFCPRCGATDRDRLMALFLDRQLGLAAARSCALLDIAPSPPLRAHLLERYPGLTYRSADKYARDVDDQIDMEAMHLYEDARFDGVLCSHVLEHVRDDRRGLLELWRVLKPGGWAVLLVPIDLSLREVLEEADSPGEDGRWRCFGQGDHLRMYSHEGFAERIAAAGFDVSLVTATDFNATAFYRHGIALTSALFVGRKPGAGASENGGRA